MLSFRRCQRPRLRQDLSSSSMQSLPVALEDRLELAGERSVHHAERDLVVDLKRAVVEIARADRAPDPVDAHHLLVERCLPILRIRTLGRSRSVAVRGMLHDRHVRRLGGGHHHADVDAAGDRAAERLDRCRLGQKVRILDPDPLPCAADGQVMEDLDRRRGAFRLDPATWIATSPSSCSSGKKSSPTNSSPVSSTQFSLNAWIACTIGPRSHGEVAEMFAVLRVAQP